MMITKATPVVSDPGEKAEWFETWFNSPYYHLLYQHRDEAEAERFLGKLIAHLQMPAGSRVLDVACGKGRHAVYLNSKGFDVTGFDLSTENIDHDKKLETDGLHFYLHDMREVFRVNYFDFVFNLFSSFGYFEKDHDNQRCITAESAALKHGGIFVMDYFNAAKVTCGLPSESETTLDGVKFRISKFIRGRFVIKQIRFSDKGKDQQFEERVGLFGPEDFQRYFAAAGLELLHTFGNYDLQAFDPASSDRLILVACKR